MSRGALRWLSIAGTLGAASLARAEVPPTPPGPGAAVAPSGQAGVVEAPLCAVASGADLGIFRLLDDTVLITEGGGPAAVCPRDRPCQTLAGDPTRAARRLMPALAGYVTSAAGRWGKHVVLTRTVGLDEGENHEVLELAGGHWRARNDGERGWLPWYPVLSATGTGHIVGIAEFESDGAHATGRQLLASPPRPRVVALDTRPGRRLLTAAPNEELRAVSPLDDGSTLVLVNRVVADKGVPLVYRLGPAGNQRVDRLPSPCSGARDGEADSDTEAMQIYGRRNDDVYAAMSASCGRRRLKVLAHFDGKGWTIVPGPSTDHDSEDLSVDSDGAVWLVAGGALYRRAPSGDWTLIPIGADGQGCAAKQVIGRGSGTTLVRVACNRAPASAHSPSAPPSSLVLGTRCIGLPVRLGGEK